jgi:hypothetical protein
MFLLVEIADDLEGVGRRTFVQSTLSSSPPSGPASLGLLSRRGKASSALIAFRLEP